MIRVRVRVKVWVSVKYYAIKVVPESLDFIACNALKDLILSLCAKPLGGWKLVITSKVLRSQPRLG
jgi:hypothetical protein